MAGDISRPHPTYDCSGNTPGNYEHPDDPTRFIKCDAGLRAIEFDCGPATPGANSTPVGRLVYYAPYDACLDLDEYTELTGKAPGWEVTEPAE
ncbi:hypothetical protein E1263_22530 [Kribbella antibiotica]|uniref:Uncharacterized protein n=1 Tax=Kribbella antibiotica TaxID=190195 RepID=A0A4R4ZIU8_9ACTN|nr:carbohydrate-binding module family 14 protein [Kribbella antibiotica]TDD57674.1 hypothetical protein E1263_22530 [Kribbella antibiotica]